MNNKSKVRFDTWDTWFDPNVTTTTTKLSPFVINNGSTNRAGNWVIIEECQPRWSDTVKSDFNLTHLIAIGAMLPVAQCKWVSHRKSCRMCVLYCVSIQSICLFICHFRFLLSIVAISCWLSIVFCLSDSSALCTTCFIWVRTGSHRSRYISR